MIQFRKLIFIVLALNLTFAQDVFQSIRVFNPTSETIKIVAKAGIPLDHIQGKNGYFIDVIAAEDQSIELITQGLNIEILIPDLTQYYHDRNVQESSREFPLGSMQGNYTWDELNNRFDELRTLYPSLISEKVVIGQSIEGRDIWAFKVSDNPEMDEDEPELLFTSLTHSREPVGMMNLFYFVQLICENYESDPELTYLTNEREIWFLPVINPDGYAYNESIQPNGGGMHRKNRRDTNCGEGTDRGVDLNRNYGYGWGANDTGSSPDPCATTYRGNSAFSEPETQIVKDFIENGNFNNVIHYHTYSNVYIHPFGNATLPEEPDLSTYREIGAEMARHNGYPVGTGYETIGYTVNGDAVDWTYGDQGLISFTPEVGSYSQGFWPSEDEIIPLCQDQVHPNKIFSFVAGSDIILYSYNMNQSNLNPGDEINLDLIIQNRGLVNAEGDIVIGLAPLTDDVTLSVEEYIISDLDARDTDQFSTTVSLNPSSVNGSISGVIVSMDYENGYSRIDTINFIIGTPDVVFFDDFESGLDNWEVTGSWGLIQNQVSGNMALSDSPEGNYEPASETTASLDINLDLSFFTLPQVKFNAKWEIESNWDFVRFQALTPELGWVSLAGEYTELGVGQPAQPLGEPGYDGQQISWVEETIDLTQLGNTAILGFRFIQTSDYYVEEDGFTFDDFSVSGFPISLQGDFNLDGRVNIYDVLGLADALIFGHTFTDMQFFIMDFDGNSTIDVLDLIALTNLIMGF